MLRDGGETLTVINAANSSLESGSGLDFAIPHMGRSTRLMQGRFAKLLLDSVGTNGRISTEVPRTLLPSRRRKCHRGILFMVSADHFAHELRTQLRNATEQGATRIVVTSTELSQSVRMGGSSMDACCQALLDELEDGDVILRDTGSGGRVIVRYLLPRAGQ
jgi:hypothetical protein